MEEKTKLINLSSDAWHYKLIKFMFGWCLPDPKKLRNLCPYFWLLIASLVLVSFVMPIYLIFIILRWVINTLANIIEKMIESFIDNWLNGLSEIQALDLYYHNEDLVKKPFFSKKYSTYSLLERWAIKHNIDIKKNKVGEYLEKFQEARIKELERNREIRTEIIKKQEIEQAKKRIKNQRNRELMDKFFSSIFTPFKKIKLSSTNFNQVIKITKATLGVILTTILIVLLFFVVHIFSLLVMLIISVWNGAAVLGFLWLVLKCMTFGILSAVIIYLIYFLVCYFIDKKREGKLSSKWLTPFVYFGTIIYKICKYFIWYPIYFIFVAFFYKFFILKLLWGILKGFGKGLVKFTGIFGEYFSATKGDYCPGIEWDNGKDDYEENFD
jgi:hypothetical protein